MKMHDATLQRAREPATRETLVLFVWTLVVYALLRTASGGGKGAHTKVSAGGFAC